MSRNRYYWCLRHDRVESPDNACPVRHLLGPFNSASEAEGALERARQRTEAWEAADEQWEGEEDPPDQWYHR